VRSTHYATRLMPHSAMSAAMRGSGVSSSTLTGSEVIRHFPAMAFHVNARVVRPVLNCRSTGPTFEHRVPTCHQIALGHGVNHGAIIVNHGQATDAVVQHDPCCMPDTVVKRNADYVHGHDVFCLHLPDP
jgi:hypothetical protein